MPTEGSSIGNTWAKSDVKPVMLVKPGIGGFEPREGSTIGNNWDKQQVIPVMLVEVSAAGFSPIRDLSSGAEYDTGVSTRSSGQALPPKAPVPQLPSVIESQVDGDFDGWEGETLVKLINGQIWQQVEYRYEYHYAFMPQVLIVKSGSVYKMKVDGTQEAVGVVRLK